MKYADMHCDSVTACCESGEDFSCFNGSVNGEKLSAAGCIAQCFAIFTEGENAGRDFEKFSAFYFDLLAKNPRLTPAYCLADIKKAEKTGGTAAVLAVENAGFLNGDISGFARLKQMGVRMVSLVWNNPNAFAFPNVICGAQSAYAREARGLTQSGRRAVEELNKLKIIIDISHLSDGGVGDVLSLSASPVVASHSNAFAVCPSPRNLTDGQLKKLADKGGVAGINFYCGFLGGEGGKEAALAHYRHMVKTGGEDLPAFGSDFDGVPQKGGIKSCDDMPPLLKYFSLNGVKDGALEKLCRGNFLRVFGEVVG